MRTDFDAVRHYLASAVNCLVGHDQTTIRIREAVGVLLKIAIEAERATSSGNVVLFRPRRDDRLD
jgi:hypothetical protein